MTTLCTSYSISLVILSFFSYLFYFMCIFLFISSLSSFFFPWLLYYRGVVGQWSSISGLEGLTVIFSLGRCYWGVSTGLGWNRGKYRGDVA